jgi:hypothetical protein
MTTQSPPRYQIFHDLTQEFGQLIKKLEADIAQRLNSSNKGPTKPFGGMSSKNKPTTGKSSFWPNLGGLKSLGRWIWTGKAENFINNTNKMTLREYIECENEINLICEEIINKNFKLNENYAMVSDIVEKFKKDAIEIVKRYAKKVEEEQAKEEKAFSDMSRQLSMHHGSPDTMSDDEIEDAYNKGAEENDEEKSAGDDGHKDEVEDIKNRTQLHAVLTGLRDIKEDPDALIDDEDAFSVIIEYLLAYGKMSSQEKNEFISNLEEESKKHPYFKLILIIINKNLVDKVLAEFVPSVPKGSGEIN